jgi:hypothetical protein
MWNENIKSFISIKNQKSIEDFIHHIYNHNEYYKKWNMPVAYLSLAKNLIESIFEIMKNTLDKEIIVSNINSICVSLEYCPDRQISELYFVYNLLTENNIDTDISLEEFIKEIIGQEKEKIFTLAVTPKNGSQNVHVLTFWKYELRNEVGFDFDFKTSFGSMGQDIFNGWHGNALKAFYSLFSPEYIIKELSERINEKSEMRCKALKMIYEDNSISKNLKRKMYTVDNTKNNNMNDVNDEIFNHSSGITVEYIKHLLLRMQIIIQKV